MIKLNISCAGRSFFVCVVNRTTLYRVTSHFAVALRKVLLTLAELTALHWCVFFFVLIQPQSFFIVLNMYLVVQQHTHASLYSQFLTNLTGIN